VPGPRRARIDLVFTLALLTLGIAGLISYRSVRELQADQERVAQAEQIAQRAVALASYLKDVETAQRGFLLTRQERFLGPYAGASSSVTAELAALRPLMSDSAHARRFRTLEDLALRRVALTDSILAMARTGRFDEATAVVAQGQGQELMDAIRSQVRAVELAEAEEVRARQREVAGTARRTIAMVLLASVLAVIVVTASHRRMLTELREREEAERATSESEQRYRRLTEASLEGIVLSQDGRIVDANPAFANRFGFAPEELVGRDLLELVAPESREEAAERLQAFDEEPSEIVALNRDGSRVFVEVRGKETTYRGRPARVSAVHDITERKRAEAAIRESEERFRSLVETASDIIYRTDLEGCFTYVNPTSVQIMGYAEERLLGMHYSELVREDAREAAAAFYAAQIAAGRRTSYYEFPAVTGYGREVWIGQNVRLLYDDTELVGFQAVARDITRQRELERMKDEFLSVVSHELRTPLTAIRGSLGLLVSGKMGTLEQRGQRMLEIAAQNTDRLVRLINDLLDIEKIESSHTSMEVQALQAGDLLERSAEAVSAVAERARVRVVVEPFEAVVSADPDRLDQVLSNLLSNAIKFSPEGATVTLGGELRDGQAVFWVRDEGRGIPADMVDAIFERFQQVDSTDARQKGGTGLGLPIARSIIQQHGGRMWVESRWGQGSTFFFSLPAVEAQRQPRADDRPLVMVVEDDPGVRALVHAYLEREDYRSRVVDSGEEALRVVGELQPAVILLDLGLPGMSGREVLRSLRQRSDTRRIPVVVLTGAGEDSGLDLAEIIGWVEKPIDHESLMSTIRWAVAPRQEHYHLLLVEDNADLAGVIAETMRERGLKTMHASSGREAIDASRRISYDLLLLDPGLPDIDGFGLVDWLRRHNRHRNVPVVVYSARELDDDQRDRLRLGPTEFFVKTRVAPEELEKRIVARLDEMIESGQTLRS
jgi:PAS domain S-box-containing protein